MLFGKFLCFVSFVYKKTIRLRVNLIVSHLDTKFKHYYRAALTELY